MSLLGAECRPPARIEVPQDTLFPAEFHGWTVTAFRQGCSDYVQITGTAVSTVRAFFGAHQDVYVVTADAVFNANTSGIFPRSRA